MNTSITQTTSSDTVTFVFTDRELMLSNIDHVKKPIAEYLARQERPISAVVFDLRNVDAIDSTAMSFLVKTHLRLSKNNQALYLKNIRQGVLNILKETRLLRDFRVINENKG